MTTLSQQVDEATGVRRRPEARWDVVRTESGRERLEMVWAVPAAESASVFAGADAVSTPVGVAPTQRRSPAAEQI